MLSALQPMPQLLGDSRWQFGYSFNRMPQELWGTLLGCLGGCGKLGLWSVLPSAFLTAAAVLSPSGYCDLSPHHALGHGAPTLAPAGFP